MKIGDRVQRVPETFGETEEIRDRNRKRKARRRAYDGTVIYIHPLGRFYVVEFRSAVTGESFREAFYPPEREGPLYDGDPVKHRKFHPEVKRRGYHQKKRRKSA